MNSQTLKKMHLEMNKTYFTMLFGENESEQLDEATFSKFKRMEALWIKDEQKNCLDKYPCNLIVHDKKVVESALRSHAVYQHPVFDYLELEASIEDLKIFIKSESVLNLEFFDYLVLSIIGVSDKAKIEIASNIWDESGKGCVNKSHTVLFKDFFDDLGLRYDRNEIVNNMSWEGISGINLFNYLSIYSFNKMKYFGMLAATEMLDPPHYNKLIKGISRLSKYKQINHVYYTEHEVLDIDHANGWLQHVVIPELSLKPHKTRDFWLGFYMRLESAKRYYDYFHSNLTLENAA